MQWTAGVDEAGRGPLAGPVYAAAVILDPQNPIEGLTDSKKLTEKQRDKLFDLVQERALSVSFAVATPKEIDELNILQATLLAMKRAVEGLCVTPGQILVDGTFVPHVAMPAEALVKGDLKEPAISAASIIAKVLRDRHMIALGEQYPEYGFEKHKGYGTKVHLAALGEFGPCEVHRMSFAPVKAVLV